MSRLLSNAAPCIVIGSIGVSPSPALATRQARVLVVGLAPGAHGSNRTGRMFTGDSSGVFLYRALYKAGFASQPKSSNENDGLELADLYISAVCRCAPPQNKPLPQEISNCLPFLQREISLLSGLEGIVCLGRIAFDNTLSLYRLQGQTSHPWSLLHGAFYTLGEGLPWLLASYHPSRQNTQTGRLTESMFDDIWLKAGSLLA